jgi:hypothetical protein
MAANLPGAHKKTLGADNLGADKNDDTRGFVAEMRRIDVMPHVAYNTAHPGGGGRLFRSVVIER